MNKKKKIRPLKDYINDKEEMINQVFACIPERQIKKMTPATLKDMSIDELKAECLVQLLTMSNNRIVNILEGQKSSVTESDKADKCKEGDILEDCDDNHASNQPLLQVEKERISAKSPEAECEQDRSVLDDSTTSVTTALKRKHKEKKHKTGKKKKKSSHEEEKNDTESKGKNLLELLELEMRAKAIRSLLKKEDELEKLKKLSVELKEQPTEDEKRKNQISNLKENNVTKLIAKTEAKQWETQMRNNIERKGQTKPSLRQTSLKTVRTLNQNDEKNSENLGGLQAMRTFKKTDTDEKTKAENYEWNVEEEKLIYEDDEYDSDDKLENETNKEEEKSEESSRSSWAERWLQSKDVKKVVATSKMLTVVRNKMKNSLKSSSKPAIIANNQTKPLVEMEGSVKEYDTLLQMHEAVMAAANAT